MLSWSDEPEGASKSSPRVAAVKGSFRAGSMERQGSGARGSFDKPGSMTRTGADNHHQYYVEKDGMKDGKDGWWARMDAGNMNADVEESKSAKKGAAAPASPGGYVMPTGVYNGSRNLWADEEKKEEAAAPAVTPETPSSPAAATAAVQAAPTSPKVAPAAAAAAGAAAAAPLAVSPTAAEAERHKAEGGKEGWQWWQKTDVGHLNDPAESGDAAKKRGGAFVSQYDITGQFAKRDLWADANKDETPAPPPAPIASPAAATAEAAPAAAQQLAQEVKDWDPFTELARSVAAAPPMPCAVAAATAGSDDWNPFQAPPAGH